MKPDFLIVPSQVAFDKKLDPVDSKIYAICYWLEHFKIGKCVASNEHLAKLSNVTIKTVQRSLERLQKAKHIRYTFFGEEENRRIAVECLETFLPHIANGTVKGVKDYTPAAKARKLFTSPTYQESAVAYLVKQGHDVEAARKQLKIFIDYWTEPTKNGKKQRWELRETFDVKKRLNYWMNRSDNKQHKTITI